ncbi:hypothetical protein K788_0002547 [Paraburkholderia caribensis MBA4]|uniref:Uncharacterized protein n=1 Tax=Paraburkholderia caribensis MBA4 TaxID=1323664 RepID=A0A0N7JU02_9BURK|nr:hypothetical protein K788_0002547 [Paraburkholderia caribensis MBA4]
MNVMAAACDDIASRCECNGTRVRCVGLLTVIDDVQANV